MTKYDAIHQLKYRWDRYDSLDGQEQALTQFPLVRKAWEDYKMAKAILEAVLRDAEAQTEFDE